MNTHKDLAEKLLLYAITDRSWLNGRTLYACTEEALKGGATCLQLREKDLDGTTFQKEALALKELTARYHVPLIINDDLQVTLAADADGIHVGQDDMEAGEVRRRIGPDKILGVSVRTVEQALRAQEQGADYLGVGAVFPTSTKTDAADVSLQTLKEISQAVEIPVVAIGGITAENAGQLRHSRIAGIAVISAIFAQEDILSATSRLKKICEESFRISDQTIKEGSR